MSRPSLPVATLTPGELVIVSLTGRAVDRISQWAGEVLAVDGVAIRIKASWHRFCLSATPAEGEKVLPWGRIERINVEAPAAEEGAGS